MMIEFFGKTPVEAMQEQEIKDLKEEVQELRRYLDEEIVPGIDMQEYDLTETNLELKTVTLPLKARVGLTNSGEGPSRLHVRGISGNLRGRNLTLSYFADARILQDPASQSRALADLHRRFVQRLAKDLHSSMRSEV